MKRCFFQIGFHWIKLFQLQTWMAPQHSKSIVDKFKKAENDILNALNRYENHIGNQVALVATSSLPTEKKIENFFVAVKNCPELRDLKSQITASLRACKIEICNVNNGFLKFIQLNVKDDNEQLASFLGLTDVRSLKAKRGANSTSRSLFRGM